MKLSINKEIVERIAGRDLIADIDLKLRAVGGLRLFGLIKTEDAVDYIFFSLLLFGLSSALGLLMLLEGKGLKLTLLMPLGVITVVVGQYLAKVRSYQEQIMQDNELPAMVETLAIGINAGKSLDSTIRYIIDHKKGLARNLLAEAMILVDGGEKLDIALKYAAAKSLSPRFEQLVRLVLEAKNSTAKLKELLLEQAEEIQAEKVNLKMERVAKLETKLFFPIFAGYFIPVIVLVAFPVLASLKGLLSKL